MTPIHQIERAAVKAFDRLLDDAEICEKLYIDAGMTVPEPLMRLLGQTPSPTLAIQIKPVPLSEQAPESRPFVLQPEIAKRPYNSKRGTFVPKVPQEPDHGPRPDGAEADWVSVFAAQATPYTLGLAILKAQERPISSAALNSMIGEVRGIKGAAGYTVMSRLVDDGMMEGDHEGWVMKDKSKGGIIVGQWLWSRIEELSEYDMAWVRREAIMLIIQENGVPLSTASITRGLRECKWLQAPVRSDVTKADMTALEKKGLIRRLENKDWEEKPKV